MSDERSTLQRSTGQGRETEGIRYPIPSINIMAILEQEYGPLEFLLDPKEVKKILVGDKKTPGRALTDEEKIRVIGASHLRMQIYLLEMQKAGKDEEVESLSSEERRKAAAKCMKMKGINIQNFDKYAKAARAVFTKAPRPNKM